MNVHVSPVDFTAASIEVTQHASTAIRQFRFHGFFNAAAMRLYSDDLLECSESVEGLSVCSSSVATEADVCKNGEESWCVTDVFRCVTLNMPYRQNVHFLKNKRRRRPLHCESRHRASCRWGRVQFEPNVGVTEQGIHLGAAVQRLYERGQSDNETRHPPVLTLLNPSCEGNSAGFTPVLPSIIPNPPINQR